jgi:WD40 repeat protein
VVKVGGKQYLVAGYDDGVTILHDLQLTKGASLRRPVFKTEKDRKVYNSLDGPYDHFHESAYEHPDSIISVEVNTAESTEATPVRIVTASKDGTVYVWRINSEADKDDDKLNYVSEFVLDEPLSRAKWLNEKTIIVTTTYGNAYILKLERDD